jgi:hypothetical protein
MVELPDRVCVPIEVEMIPLHRQPPGSARLRREQKRHERQRRREQREHRVSPTRAERLRAVLATGASALIWGRHG